MRLQESNKATIWFRRDIFIILRTRCGGGDNPMSAIVHFDVPAEDTGRAKKFYETLFGWKFESWPGMDFYLISTKNLDGTPGVGGGLGERMDPSQRMMNYFGVQSIDAAMKKVTSLGGKLITGKMPVPGMGYLANCMDTEGNFFGLWEENKEAK
jgi:predicted enzyme related to lactoylglutathione lyase